MGAAVILATMLGPTVAAYAAEFVVDSTADAPDANAGDGVCATASGRCTLRAAVMETNALPGKNTIRVPEGTYRLRIADPANPAEIDAPPFTSAAGDLSITNDLDLLGAGAEETIVDGNQIDRVFDIPPSGKNPTIKISGLTIRNGNPGVPASPTAFFQGGGGGVRNFGGTLTLQDDIIRDNHVVMPGAAAGGVLNAVTTHLVNVQLIGNTVLPGATGPSGQNGSGGAAFNFNGLLTLDHVIIRDNTAETGGGLNSFAVTRLTDVTLSGNSSTVAGAGGIINARAGVMTLDKVTLNDNHSAQDGGAIANAGASLTLNNVTISGNTATNGGGIANRGTMTMDFVTIANNSAANGGNINNFVGGSLQMRASIVSHALAGGNCFIGAAIASPQGDNISSDATCNLSGPGDRNNLNPQLGPLARNGGFTRTLALRPFSPAIDDVTHSTCPPPATDQRGVVRPQGRACDSGAYERKTGHDDDDNAADGDNFRER
jgi:CSLREA domain-containing protein